VDDYRLSDEPWPTSARAIADWAIRNGKWSFPTPRCAEDIAAAMREEYTTDKKGRRVRLLHPAAKKTDTGEQLVLWHDIRTAPRTHMEISFQQRRLGIVGDCRQFKQDVDSYNDSHPEAEPLQVVFDFSMDLAELEAADNPA